MKTVIGCALALLFIFLLFNIINSYRDMLQIAERVDKIQNRVEAVRRDNVTAQIRLRALTEDPLYRERLLIEGGIVKKGEKVIKVFTR